MKNDAHTTTDSLYEVIKLVRPLYKTLESSVALELEKAGITVSQRAVLEQLQGQGPLTVPDIGRRLILPRQFIQKIVNELLALALIERLENAAHKRSVLLALTAEGQNAIAQIMARERAVMAPIAQALKSSDVAMTKAVMTKIIGAFGAHNAQTTKQEKEETT